MQHSHRRAVAKNVAARTTTTTITGRTQQAEVQPRVFSEQGAAAYIGVSHNALRDWRAQGKGPTHFRPGAGKLIKYRKADLDAYIEARLTGQAAPEQEQRNLGPSRAMRLLGKIEVAWIAAPRDSP